MATELFAESFAPLVHYKERSVVIFNHQKGVIPLSALKRLKLFACSISES